MSGVDTRDVVSLPNQTAAMIAKDLRREVRSKEITTTTVAFSVMLMALFAFAFWIDDESTRHVFPGILWVSIVFTGTLAIGRTFVQERDHGCLRALALVPGTGLSLYLAKLVVNLMFVGVFELVLIPALVIVFDVDFMLHAAEYLAIVGAGTLGFCAVGTLVAAMMVHNHMRDVMLPILLFPLTIPLIIAGVVVTKLIVSGELENVWRWIRVVGAMDAAFLILSALLFRWVLGAIE